MDPAVDRSNPNSLSLSKMATALSAFINQAGCIDPLVVLFLTEEKVLILFTCTSFLFKARFIFYSSVKKILYSAIVESDHASLLLDLSFSLDYTERPPWRLKTTLLADREFCTMLSTSIDNFLETNRSYSISPFILWETLKVVIREDNIIPFSA